MVVGIFFGWGFEILALSYLRLVLLSEKDRCTSEPVPRSNMDTARARDQIHPATLEKPWRSGLR